MKLDAGMEGVPRATRMIGRISGRIRDLRPAFRVFDRTVGEAYRKQFETSGEHLGTGPWKPLAPSTRKRRARSGGNRGGLDRPLWDTGETKASFQEAGGNSVRVIERDHYERGSRLRRAFFHQEGRGVPKREIVPDRWPRFLVREWTRTAGDYLEGKFPGGL